MKKSIKYILSFIISGILFTSAGAYAASVILSKDVSFDNSKNDLESTNVQDAIDEIYEKEKYGTATASNILNGKSALVNGKKISGTMIDNGAVEEIVIPNSETQTIAIPEGYHNGEGKIIIRPSSAVTGSDIFSGLHTHTNYTGYKDFENIVTNNGDYITYSSGTIIFKKDIANVKITYRQAATAYYYVYKNDETILSSGNQSSEINWTGKVNKDDTIKLYRYSAATSNDIITLIITVLS